MVNEKMYLDRKGLMLNMEKMKMIKNLEGGRKKKKDKEVMEAKRRGEENGILMLQI